MTRRPMKFVGRRDGRDVYVTTLCPPGGTRRLIKDTGLVVAGRRVFVFAECRVGRLDESPENCYGWDGAYVSVDCLADPVPTTLVGTFTAHTAGILDCDYMYDDGARYALPVHYRDSIPLDYSGHTAPGWVGTKTITVGGVSKKVGLAIICSGFAWKTVTCPAIDDTVDAWVALGTISPNRIQFPSAFETTGWVYGSLSASAGPLALESDGAIFLCKELMDNDPTNDPRFDLTVPGSDVCACGRVDFAGLLDPTSAGNSFGRLVVSTPWEFGGPGESPVASGSGSGGPCFDPDLGPATQFADRALMKRVGFRAGRWVFAKACCPVEEGVGGGGFVQTICCPNPLRETLHAVVTSGGGSPCGMAGETIEMNYNPLDDQWQGTSSLGIVIRMFCDATAQPFRVIVTDGAGNQAEGSAVLTSCDPPQFDCTDLAATIGSPTCVSPDTTIQFLE